MSYDCLNELLLPLDERNLAHVLCAVAFVGLASRISAARPLESTCWWGEQGFILRTAFSKTVLFDMADGFLRRVRWIPGMGTAEQGIFTADTELGSNPFISLADDGQENSPFKTFSGQIDPGKLLNEQQGCLRTPTNTEPWLLQTSRGVASWGFDCRVGSHAYDVVYSLWTRPISLPLVSCAVAARLDGLAARRYRVTNRGAAYGKGAAYRFFPESALRS
ncbi:MAG: hypothetical protein ABSC05_34500 [Candidatus Solibacter sp.]